jgi:hypothetical protein
MPVEVSVYRRRRQVARFNTRTSGYVSMTAKRRVLLSVPPLEPIPETVEAVNELDPSVEDGDLLADLTELANHAQEIVPDLVGVSVARMAEGLTFTLVATAAGVAVLDGIQHIAGGPCVDGAHTEEVCEFNRDDFLVNRDGVCSPRRQRRGPCTAP